MRRVALAILLAATFAACSAHAASSISTDPRKAPAGSYAMETNHTQLIFAISHLGLTDYYGRFDKVSGTLIFNPSAPEKSAVDVAIDMTSVNVMSSQLVGEIAGPEVFDSAKFPKATFKSTSAVRTGPTSGKITGNLTLHGVIKPVTFDVTFNGGAPSAMGAAAYDLGFHATATVKRSDFGLNTMLWTNFIGDEVRLTIEALFQKPRK